VASLAHVSKPLRSAINVMNHPEIASAMRRFKDGRINLRLTNIYKTIAADAVGNTVMPTGPLGGIFNSRVLSNVVIALLGNSPKIASYQFGSILSAMTKIEAVHVMSALADGALIDTSIDQEWKEWSPQIYHRTNVGTAGLVNSGSIGRQSVTGFANRQDRNMFMIRAVDTGTIRLIWGSYKSKLSKAGLKGDALMSEVAKQTWENVTDTQPTQDPLHLSGLAIEARTNRLAKPLTLFRSQRSKEISILMTELMRMRRDPTYMAKGLKNIMVGFVAQSMSIVGMRWLWRTMLILLGSTLGSAVFRGEFAPRFIKAKEEEDEVAIRLLVDVIKGPFSPFIFSEIAFGPLNRIATGSFGASSNDISPVSGVFLQGVDAIEGMARYPFSNSPNAMANFIDSTVELILSVSVFSGIPLVSPARDTNTFMKEFLAEMESQSGGIVF